MSIGTMLFNPFTGKPRDPRDIASDPRGILVWDGEEPLRAATPPKAEQQASPQAQPLFEVFASAVGGTAYVGLLAEELPPVGTKLYAAPPKAEATQAAAGGES